jgi:hypothetical protein
MLFAALNQETAQQYEDAVYSFESALKSASPVIPLQLIGNHLNRIQKDHPKEFTDGVALYRSHN